ncbi:DUF3231 family protein [Anoxybacteroides amylolyticum]|uniref:DUF3231 family protein n=1 Tax=Anoxybacteroides amylolyticum TaxID=294699 RepID=A0A160F6I8_9BACL|nr:DUF3231 family protein [Anoxybacillus amylolyticus]ANB61463.1 hypothetical protein GFC30_2847 [Anoxybacillus amylolyticus]
MKTKTIRLTSAEIANSWHTYMYDSMVESVMTHFKQTAEDAEVKLMVEKMLETVQKHLHTLEKLFCEEGIAKPDGFPVEKHVHMDAPKLFSDVFYLEYINQMTQFKISSHMTSIVMASRHDIQRLFTEFIQEAIELNGNVRTMMKEKGVHIRPPYMEYPKKVDYVEKQNFLTGWLGRRRPLLAVEAAYLVMNSMNNEIAKSTLTGFAQVTKDPEIRNFFIRGQRVTSDIIISIFDVLQENDIPASMTWDTVVNDSTVAPFSEQLMLFLIHTLSGIGMAMYGQALSLTMRRDLAALYLSFMGKAGAYAEDGVNLMIERGWLEQPPHFLDRQRLIKESN